MTLEPFTEKHARKDTLGQFKLHETARALKPKRSYLVGARKEAAKERVYQYLLSVDGRKISYTTVFVKADISSEATTMRLIDELIREGRVTKQRAGSGIRFYCHGEVKTIQDAVTEAATIEEPKERRTQSEPNYDHEFLVRLDALFLDYANTAPTADYLIGANAFRRHVHRQLSKEGEN